MDAQPAWVACDILLNKRYGAGASFSEEDIDWISAKEWADYCDGLVYDGTGNLQTLNSGSASDISDLKYDSTLNSGYGGIEVQFWPGKIRRHAGSLVRTLASRPSPRLG